jgi:hypothetical protein
MDMEADVVVEQLKNLEKAYPNMQKGLLAYTVRQYLLIAIEKGCAERVLNDPKLQTVFMDARLATDCGWRDPALLAP